MVEITVLDGYGRLSDRNSSTAVIVLHPWGLLGGNMNNNVVIAGW